MPPYIFLHRYNAINYILYKSYQKVANGSTFKAAQKTYCLISRKMNSCEPVMDSQISIDDTWQKHGHTSAKSVVTAISKENGKCIDTHVLSEICKGCSMWGKNRNKPGYQEWKTNHNRQINHAGISSRMEPAGPNF